jgi:hypothetical protein
VKQNLEQTFKYELDNISLALSGSLLAKYKSLIITSKSVLSSLQSLAF